MKVNVHITAYRKGVAVDHRIGHNVWVDNGRAFLANAIAFTSPVQSTTEGAVDLAVNFPTLTNEYLIIRRGYQGVWVENRIALSSPADSTALLAQINSQISGVTASLGGSNGLVFTPDAPTTLELVVGSAFPLLGLVPEYVAPAGYTTTPLDTRRIRYMGFGIGGNKQNLPSVSAPPLSTSYPPGFDPNATTGNEYAKEFPSSPPIRSLERPIRITGGTNDYGSAAPTDVWLVQDPAFTNYIPSSGVMSFHGIIDTSGGDVLYGPFVDMPLSEVGLFLSDSDVNDPFNVDKMVAYFSFATLLLTQDVTLELVWMVSF